MDQNQFFGRKPEAVAKDLLGRYLVRQITGSRIVTATIAEVGAYSGDLNQPSRAGMNYAPGTLFMMPHRGYHLLNVATEREGTPSCIEIRAVDLGEAHQDIANKKLVSGSARIANLFKVASFDGRPFNQVFRLGGSPVAKGKVTRTPGQSENCLGYFSLKL